MKLDKDYYNVVFHYNVYSEKWNCVSRTRYRDYFNGNAKDSVGHGTTTDAAFKDYKQKACKTS
jgi:hypothetical protein